MSSSTQVPFRQVQMLIQAEEQFFLNLFNGGILDAGQAYVRLQIAIAAMLASCGWKYEEYEQALEAQAAVDAMVRAYIEKSKPQSSDDK